MPMEDILSSSESDTDSDEYTREKEEELYAVLHHNDFSKGIPNELSKKYFISTNQNNEFVISFKSPQTKTMSRVRDIDTNSPQSLNSTDDVVVVESEDEPISRKSINRESEKVLMEECSDSSVEVIEVNAKRKRTSSLQSVISLSSDDKFNLSINTTGNLSYESDSSVSGAIIASNYKWENVASPSTWTKEMRMYYNKPCEKLRCFDHKKIRSEIRKEKNQQWTICERDFYPDRSRRRKCAICRQSDHIAVNCPKSSNSRCYMCGGEGHLSIKCPNSLCLQCGKRNNRFTTTCSSCAHFTNRECFKCKQTGHESKFCPEKWREFHSTVNGELHKTAVQKKDKTRIQTPCCNCGHTGHSYDQCKTEYLSNSLTSLPDYEWLVKKGGSDNFNFTPKRNKPTRYKRQEHPTFIDRPGIFNESFPRTPQDRRLKGSRRRRRKYYNQQ